MSLPIILFLFGMGNATISGDPCSALTQESHCSDGLRCNNIYWLDRAGKKLAFSDSNYLNGLLDVLTCAEAAGVSATDLIDFDTKHSVNVLIEMNHLINELLGNVAFFPQHDKTDDSALLLHSILERSRIPTEYELRVAVMKLFTENALKTFLKHVERVAGSFIIQGIDLDEKVRNDFLIFVSIAHYASRFSGDQQLLIDVDPLLEDSLLFDIPDPVDPSDSERIERILDRIQRVVQMAQTVSLELSEGTLPSFIEDAGIFNFFLSAKLVYRIRQDSVEPSPVSLFFSEQVCQNIVPIAEYIALLSKSRPWIPSHVRLGVGTVLALCRDETSAEDRIRISAIFGSPVAIHPRRTGVLTLPADENYLEDSDVMLRGDESPFAFNDIEVVFEGFEDVGHIGQRRKWINDLIDRYFTPRTNAGIFEQIWRYTDDTRQFITLREDLVQSKGLVDLFRSAGRVIGLAIKFNIPLGIPIARSLLKRLRMHVQEIDHNEIRELMRVEDSALFKHLEGLRLIDWTDPPPSVKWISFDGLIDDEDQIFLNGENFETFIKLKTEDWFHGPMPAIVYLMRTAIMDVVGSGIFTILTENEFEERILPRPDGFTAELILGGVVFNRFPPRSPLPQWFRETVIEMSTEQLYLLNIFVTGARQPPLSADTDPWIKIFLEEALDVESLPRSHTCHGELQLPPYSDKDMLKRKLIQAISESDRIEGYMGYNQEQLV